VSQSITIKQILLEQIESLVEISCSTFSDTFSEFNTKEDMEHFLSTNYGIEKLKSELLDPKSIFYFALNNEVPIGFLKLGLHSKLDEFPNIKTLEIERLYVSKEFHDKKIGAKLMEFSLNFAKENQYKIVWLGVWEYNQKAIHFYHKWGFEQFGSKVFTLGNDEQVDFTMKIDL
jgi:ribosomal protein S18 acetylase RimI-like enzyme